MTTTDTPISVDLDALLASAFEADRDGRVVAIDNGDGFLDEYLTDPDALVASASGPNIVLEVNPLAAQPPSVSLLSSAPDVTGLLDAAYGPNRWLNGISFEPEVGALNVAGVPAKLGSGEFPYWWHCPEAGGFLPSDASSDNPTGGTKKFPAKPTNVTVRPVVAFGTDPCKSVIGMFGRDAEARAKRVLESNLPRLAEAELWSGTAATAAAFLNPRLDGTNPAPAVINAGNAVGYLSALAELEQQLIDNSATVPRNNVDGVIHAQRRLVDLWISEQVVFPSASGRQLRTRLGTLVIPGVGYPGTRAGAAAVTRTNTWAYATGPVVWARTPAKFQIDIPPGAPPLDGQRESDWLSRDVQDRVVRAESMFTVFWDARVNVAARADLTTRIS